MCYTYAVFSICFLFILFHILFISPSGDGHFHKKSKKTEVDKDLLQAIYSYFTINEFAINCMKLSCL